MTAATECIFNLPANISDLKRQFQQTGCVSIDNFMHEDIAEQIRNEMAALPWELAYVANGQPQKIAVSQIQKMHPAEQATFFSTIARYASENKYSFSYDSYMLVTHYLKGTKPGSVLHRYVEQVCGTQFVKFMRELTGNNQIIKADGQASRYLPGHFLKQHNDDGAPSQHVRHAAYTLSFNPRWDVEWGGILHLQDQNGAIEQSLTPTYNRLNVFAVPRNHFVSQVANYCPEARLSIVGWFRSDKN